MPEFSNGTRLTLHAGAHKTGTTSLQRLLRRNSGALAKRGLHYIHHRHVRKGYTVPCQYRAYDILGLDYDPTVTEADLTARIDTFSHLLPIETGERILISEENLFGHCGQCARQGTLYPRREIFSEIFFDHLPVRADRIYFCIRSYPDFFASAYVEFVRSANGYKYIPYRRMCQNVLEHPPNWSDCLALLRKRAPDAQLFVWRYEDMKDRFMKIFEHMTEGQMPPDRIKVPTGKSSRPSASQRAIDAIEEYAAAHGADAAIERRQEFQDKYPRGETFERFDPWKQHERDHLRRLYEKDWSRILNTSGTTDLADEIL
ncbi:hypothetical protein [Oceanomicrobium pacificus]|uniref:Sulfotransferase domain-containing protein n=1 Tax=Oceanomicrobium pacificus TaxID=2692916 RepID=A0A6B0TKT4_9RHOB|nr:hypothetical protein [Oceanomicrobium pacificus]MXU65130.1 hypothetical protein [Oceanomicrobium pacificus]